QPGAIIKSCPSGGPGCPAPDSREWCGHDHTRRTRPRFARCADRQPLATLDAPAPYSSVPTRKIGSYELIEELGRGGLGQVWRARDPGLRREVALKVLLRDASSLSPADRERFAREAEAQARVRTPGLAEVYHLDLLAT